MRRSARPGPPQQFTAPQATTPTATFKFTLAYQGQSGGWAREKLSSLHTAPCSHLRSKCSHCGPLTPTSLKTNELHLLFRSASTSSESLLCWRRPTALLPRFIHAMGTVLSIISACMSFAYCVSLVFTKHKCKQRQRLKQSFQNTRAHTKDTHEHQILNMSSLLSLFRRGGVLFIFLIFIVE